MQAWIKNGFVTVNDAPLKQKDAVRSGQSIRVAAPLLDRDPQWAQQDIPIDALYEDDAVIVLNKPAGLVVHPGAGNPDRTLVNALLFHYPELAQVPRAGIVHRLDKETSGIMAVAKSLEAHTRLVRDLQSRKITREYRAIVHGRLISGGRVTAPVGRHPAQRTRMAVTDRGKAATTRYRVIERLPAGTFIGLTLETGRTHQIRVHAAHLGHPVIGDPVYGGRKRIPRQATAALRDIIAAFPRQALHALRLKLLHPLTRQPREWRAPLAADIEALLAAMRQDAAGDE